MSEYIEALLGGRLYPNYCNSCRFRGRVETDEGTTEIYTCDTGWILRHGPGEQHEALLPHEFIDSRLDKNLGLDEGTLAEVQRIEVARFGRPDRGFALQITSGGLSLLINPLLPLDEQARLKQLYRREVARLPSKYSDVSSHEALCDLVSKMTEIHTTTPALKRTYPRAWECIDPSTFRLPVPGGWLVLVYESTSDPGCARALTFFPDPDGAWVLEEKK
jgi:hypothetical protein